jgi:choline kinase
MRNNGRFITSPQKNGGRIDDRITVILLSEKVGHRMKSYGPTPLLKLGQRTLLESQISAIKSVFHSVEIIICCGFDCEKTVRFIRDRYPSENIRIVENQMHPHSNCCESSRLCLNNTNSDKVLLCNGGLTLSSEILSLVNPMIQSHIISESSVGSNLEVGFITSKTGFAEGFSYGIKNIWSEIVFFNSRETIEAFRSIVTEIDYKNRFVFEALNELIKTKHKLKIIENSIRPLVKIDNIKTYHTVRRNNEGTNPKLHNK